MENRKGSAPAVGRPALQYLPSYSSRDASQANAMDKLYRKAARRLLLLPILLAIVLFVPAGTLAYWEAWLFIAVFVLCSLAITVYLAVRDPQLLARRMKVGPRAETEPAQKIIMVLVMVGFTAAIVVPALDHRFGWSAVPAAVVILGDLLIVLAHVVFTIVFRANTYGAATIQVAENQTVVSTGPYAVVRHPMYSGALILMVGIPLALGSWWGLALIVPILAGLVWRLIDEERFLSRNLSGYPDYMRKVRWRLVPFVW
jgi:protein-S-isoprenylcysteine O-methyltransferase Ste14